MVRNLTEGKPLPIIFMFGLPMLLGNLFSQFYSLINGILVGDYLGNEGIAAVGSANVIAYLFTGFVVGMVLGFSIPVAKFFGGNNFKMMRKSVANAVILSGFFAVVMSVLTVMSIDLLLDMTNSNEDVRAYSKEFLTIIFSTLTFPIIYNLLVALLRAVGNSKSQLTFVFINAALCILFDFIYIKYMSLGIVGVAFSGITSQIITSTIMFFYIKKKVPDIIPQKGEWVIDFDIMKQQLSLGMPIGGQFSIASIGAIIQQAAINLQGVNIIAAITAANRIQAFCTGPMEIIGITMSTYNSQNLGAGKIDRIKKGMRQMTVFQILFCIFSFALVSFIAPLIAPIFIEDTNGSIEYLRRFLFLNGVLYIPLGFVFLFRNALQGLGDGFIPLIGGVLETIGRTIMSVGMLPIIGFTALGLSSPLAWVLASAILVPTFLIRLKSLNRKFINVQSIAEQEIAEDEKLNEKLTLK